MMIAQTKLIELLLMEEILHQLIDNLSQDLSGFIHLRWCKVCSINNTYVKFKSVLHIYGSICSILTSHPNCSWGSRRNDSNGLLLQEPVHHPWHRGTWNAILEILANPQRPDCEFPGSRFPKLCHRPLQTFSCTIVLEGWWRDTWWCRSTLFDCEFGLATYRTSLPDQNALGSPWKSQKIFWLCLAPRQVACCKPWPLTSANQFPHQGVRRTGSVFWNLGVVAHTPNGHDGLLWMHPRRIVEASVHCSYQLWNLQEGIPIGYPRGIWTMQSRTSSECTAGQI